MATRANQPAQAGIAPLIIKDLEDLGYQQAGTYQASVGQAQYALDNIAGFPDEVPQEARDKLYAGYRKRFSQINPAKTYAVINGHYVTPTEDQLKNPKQERVEIGVDYAFSYSSQEFGKLSSTNAPLHELVKEIREKTSTYCSNRLGDLKRQCRKILNQGKERKRTANKNFSEYVEAFFTDAFDRLKSAKSRGDATADLDRFNKAKVAFMVAWKHGD
jgi:hypothetical protein